MSQPKPEIDEECFNCPLPDCNPDRPDCLLAMETIKIRMRKADVTTLKNHLRKVSGQGVEVGIVEALGNIAGMIRARG